MRRLFNRCAHQVTVAAFALGAFACSGRTAALPGNEGNDRADAGADGGSVGDGPDGAALPPVNWDGGQTPCTYTDDASFCNCMGFNCGGVTTQDGSGAYHSVYCGSCPDTQVCTTSSSDVLVGRCGGQNLLPYSWQRRKIDMLVSMGENDNTNLNYDYCQNINDGRGYTIGKVGFCSGTGDFVIVAACYRDLAPNNVLAKYWPALTYYAQQLVTANANQGDTSKLDAIGNFCADVATAAADPIFQGCQDAAANASYMSPASAHAAELHLTGALTIGFLYDMELNFGDDDDPPSASGKPGTPGARTMIKLASADYGANMPTDFTGKPWEESRWLGFLIKERAIAMSADRTWKKDMDQDATWEAARRLHTASSNDPESGTDLSMDYDIVSAYKAGAPAPTPCWGMPPLASNWDTQSSVINVSLDKSASATDPAQWKAISSTVGDYAACPADPTP